MKRIIGAATVVALILITGIAGQSFAAPGGTDQVVVCKYVGTPGVDEVLQTGQNPIVVSVNALEGKGFAGTFPFAFEDAQGQSIAIRYAVNSHDGDVTECPGYVAPSPSPSVDPSPSDEPTPSVTPSPTPTVEPTPSESPSPSSTPSESPTPSQSVTPTPSTGPRVHATPPPTDTEATASTAEGFNATLFAIVFIVVFVITFAVVSVSTSYRR